MDPIKPLARRVSWMKRGILLGLLGLAALPRPALALPDDPLIGILYRINSYFHRNEIDGITRDARYAINPSEVTRLSIVSQLLGYNEMYRAHRILPYHEDIVARADFLVAHFNEIISRTPFDGMLGYAMLSSYQVTGDPVYLSKGTSIVNMLKNTHISQLTLNWGLMGAMALAKYYELTGDAAALQKTRNILGSLRYYQHADGSFPHYCIGSTDIHYTGWMAMELILIKRMVDDPTIDPILWDMARFMRARSGSDGITRYQDPCPGIPDCWIYYYSILTGCYRDYDTRAWINELGYSAMLFDYFADAKFEDAMTFLRSLETNGSFADKWNFWPAPWDPIYPWAIPDPSIIRTSVVFWSLASIYNGRGVPRSSHYAVSHAPAGESLLDQLPGGGDGDPGGDPPAAEELDGPVRTTGWWWADSLIVAGVNPRDFCAGDTGGEEDGGDLRRFGTRRVTQGNDAALGAGRLARLGPVLPHPAPRSCTVRFSLAREEHAALAVYDASGRRIRSLMAGRSAAGEQAVRWDGRDDAGRFVPEGVYLVRLDVAAETHAAKVLLMH